MTEILDRIARAPRPLSPGKFADICGDFDFDGTATAKEMESFWSAAWGSFCERNSVSMLGTLRSIASYELKTLLALSSSPYFPKLNVNKVLYQMLIRVLSPKRVNQMHFGICGPAHFMVMLLKSRPMTYVQFGIRLLLNGHAKGEDGFDIIPNEFVRNHDPGTDIPQADWLIAGSLRNVDGPVPPGKAKQGEYGGTRAPDVFALCLHAGYSRVIALTTVDESPRFFLDQLASTTFLKGGYQQYHPENTRTWMEGMITTADPLVPGRNIRIAQALTRFGWRVMLKISSDWASSVPRTPESVVAKNWESMPEEMRQMILMQPEEQRVRQQQEELKRAQQSIDKEKREVVEKLTAPNTVLGFIPAPTANHWVLAKTVNIDESLGTIEITIYTWGGKRTPGVMSLDVFLKGYAGFVAAVG